MNLYPLTPMSMEFIAAAAERTEHVGTRDDGQTSVTAYHFPFDPDTGVPFATTVLVASFAAGEYAEFVTYPLATRLWRVSWIKSSAVVRVMKKLHAKLDNPDSSR
ncbi:hypothetical protein SEA_LIGMA_56 [Gordonia phage Ligma]|nr:hypothetical protein SEA_LIGMA_56 [Gordonia phage Ligma]UQT02155.1 hypothetical protein SEA_AXUMITE_56 [Gordonia phage Axumite]